MDRHPQQIKRERQDKKRRETNIKNLSKLKTLIKNVLSTKNVKDAEPMYNNTVSYIDKMAQSGLIHKNTAARRKSQIPNPNFKIANLNLTKEKPNKAIFPIASLKIYLAKGGTTQKLLGGLQIAFCTGFQWRYSRVMNWQTFKRRIKSFSKFNNFFSF